MKTNFSDYFFVCSLLLEFMNFSSETEVSNVYSYIG